MNKLLESIWFPINADNLHIRSEQIRSRLKNYLSMIFGQMVLLGIFNWMMWGVLPHTSLLLSDLLLALVWTAELVWWWNNRNRVDTVQECTRWHIAFLVFTGFLAVFWGGTTLWLLPADLMHQILLLALLLGLAGASVGTNTVYLSSFYIWIIGVLVPPIVRFASVDEELYWAIAGFIALYFAVLLKSGRDVGAAFQEALEQRFAKERVIQQLVAQQAIVNQARSAAESASQEKSRFIATASHDLRQPLQALILFSDALSMAKANEVEVLAEQIGKSVSALASMFDELLDVSRLDAGVVEPRWQAFELQPLLERVWGDMAPVAESKGLSFEMPSGNWVLFSDPVLVQRILNNLISNAIRYTDHGYVRLHCNRVEAGWLIEVEDSGVGITSEALPHIFAEYFQVHNPQRDRRKGLGLGLAIVRRIGNLLGLQIEVQSEAGKGSVFSFVVPDGDAGLVAQPVRGAHSRYDLGGIVVALVEDDPDIRGMLDLRMRSWGCEVVADESYGEVMRQLKERNLRPGLLLCDYRLPLDVTAIQVIRQMRKQWGDDLPAVVLTGDTAAATLHEINASGAMLLHKPVAPDRLLATMYFSVEGAIKKSGANTI
jgi:signal transduction histidine kinase/ActR/RegA family two-component response regulator